MPFQYKVYKTQRISLVSFQRAVTGPPQIHYPDIDNRGFFRSFDFSAAYPFYPKTELSGVDRGPIVGITEGNTSFVQIKRERIDDNAPLVATSSNEKVMSVFNQEKATRGVFTGELPKSGTMNLGIQGKQGSGGIHPKVAKVEIRYGSQTGVIIAELTVFVFTKVLVNLKAFVVKIRDIRTDHFYPELNHDALIKDAKAIWEPCGVTFVFNQEEIRLDKVLANAGQFNLDFDMDTKEIVAGGHHADEAINLYFVNQVLKIENGSDKPIFGLAIAPPIAKKRGIKPLIAVSRVIPKIVPGATRLVPKERDGSDMAGTLAHEIGHYLGLDHTDNKEKENRREDIWSKRMLLYPVGGFDSHDIGINGVKNVGYGDFKRGGLITMKDLVDSKNRRNHSTDPEWETVRTNLFPKPVYEIK